MSDFSQGFLPQAEILTRILPPHLEADVNPLLADKTRACATLTCMICGARIEQVGTGPELRANPALQHFRLQHGECKQSLPEVPAAMQTVLDELRGFANDLLQDSDFHDTPPTWVVRTRGAQGHDVNIMLPYLGKDFGGTVSARRKSGMCMAVSIQAMRNVLLRDREAQTPAIMFMCSGWRVETKEDTWDESVAPRDHPDRQEVVMVQLATPDRGWFITWPIIRDDAADESSPGRLAEGPGSVYPLGNTPNLDGALVIIPEYPLPEGIDVQQFRKDIADELNAAGDLGLEIE